MSFIITPDILKIGADAFDSLIAQLGRRSRLYYAPVYTPCSCANSNIGNLSGTYDYSGSPINYPMGGVCSLCSGKGQIATEVYEDVTLLINWELKTFDKVWEPMILRLPDGSLQAKGHIEILPKITACSYMVVDLDLAAYGNYRFALYSQPISPQNIIKHRYFTSLWTQVKA